MTALPPSVATRLLRQTYEQGGYVRVKMDRHKAGPRRAAGRGVRSGWEVRLPANDAVDAPTLSASLRALGFRPGSPYRKGPRMVVPLYGREQVEQFLRFVKPGTKSELPDCADDVDMRFANQSARRGGA